MFVIEKMENELNALQRRHDNAIQEIGRLESKLQTFHLDSQNENDLLKQEVHILAINLNLLSILNAFF